MNIDEVNKELEGIKVKITNPYTSGVKDIADNFALIDGHKDRIVEIFCQTNSAKSILEQQLKDLQCDKEQAYYGLMISDKTKDFKNQDLREAYVQNEMSVQLKAIRDKERELSGVKTFFENVAKVLEQLKEKNETNSRMLTSLKYGIWLGEVQIKEGDLDKGAIFMKIGKEIKNNEESI